MTPIPLLCCLHPLPLTQILDSTTLHISPAMSFLESDTQNKAGKPDVGRRAGLPGDGGDLQESLVPGEERKGTVYNSSWPSDLPLS